MNKDVWEVKGSQPALEMYIFEIPIGATGAPGTPVHQRGLNKTTPLTRTSAGLYMLNIDPDGAPEIVGFHCEIQTATPTTVAQGAVARLVSRTPNGATPNVTFQCVRTDTAAAADPANGDILVGWFMIKNTNA